MLEKIKHYYLVAVTLVTAVLLYLFLRRGEKIRDLQRQAVIDKMKDRLKDLVQKTDSDEKEFNDAVENYNNLRNSYNKLFPNDSGNLPPK